MNLWRWFSTRQAAVGWRLNGPGLLHERASILLQTSNRGTTWLASNPDQPLPPG